MRFNFLVLAAVLPTVLLVAGAPVTDEVELIARGAGKTTPKVSTPAKASASTTTSKKTSCPAKSSRKSAPLGRRANIIIGYTGADDAQAAKYKQSATRADNRAARLGTGLYLTDSLKLAEVFADKAKRADRSGKAKAAVCQISIDEATWVGLSKIWIPKGDMINLNPSSDAETKRKTYETEQCVKSPSVRFAKYDIDGAPANSYELVIPPSLQKDFHADCKNVPQSTAIDSDDETPMFPKLGFTYKDKTSAWSIAGTSP